MYGFNEATLYTPHTTLQLLLNGKVKGVSGARLGRWTLELGYKKICLYMLINNIQWIHVPVLVNLTAWSPDLDERCREESVAKMYKDHLTTAFLRYHGSVATSSPTYQLSGEHSKDRSERISSKQKLLGFVDSILGATVTG